MVQVDFDWQHVHLQIMSLGDITLCVYHVHISGHIEQSTLLELHPVWKWSGNLQQTIHNVYACGVM